LDDRSSRYPDFGLDLARMGAYILRILWKLHGTLPMTIRDSKVVKPFMTACRQALMITVAAVILGLMVNALRPQGLDLVRSSDPGSPAATETESAGPQPIKLEDALEQLKNQNAIIIDARSEFDYAAGHIDTARNLQEKNLDAWMPDFFSATPPETPLIVYCSGPRCLLAEHLAVRMFDLGYTNVHILTAGWNGWLARGYPVAPEPAFTAGQSLAQTGDCESDECGDEQISTPDPTQNK